MESGETPTATPSYSLVDLFAYFLKLEAIGFGGPADSGGKRDRTPM